MPDPSPPTFAYGAIPSSLRSSRACADGGISIFKMKCHTDKRGDVFPLQRSQGLHSLLETIVVVPAADNPDPDNHRNIVMLGFPGQPPPPPPPPSPGGKEGLLLGASGLSRPSLKSSAVTA